MTGTLEFSEVSFTLTDLLVAAYNITANTYGTPASMAVGQTLEVESDHDTDKLAGYGAYRRLLSVAKGAKLKFGGGGIDSNVVAILAGATNSTSGTTPNQRRRQLFSAGGGGLPYFGVIGVAATDDGGLALIGLQCCKLDKYPTIKADGKENKFNMWESEGYAIPIAVSGSDYLFHKQDQETASNWTTPSTGANFLAFFTGPV